MLFLHDVYVFANSLIKLEQEALLKTVIRNGKIDWKHGPYFWIFRLHLKYFIGQKKLGLDKIGLKFGRGKI